MLPVRFTITNAQQGTDREVGSIAVLCSTMESYQYFSSWFNPWAVSMLKLNCCRSVSLTPAIIRVADAPTCAHEGITST